MAREPISGTIIQHIVVNGLKTRSTVMAFMNGQTEEDMKANGLTTTCTDKECTPGKMAESTKENT